LALVGTAVGLVDGAAVVGVIDGADEGPEVGASDGDTVGLVGASEGNAVGGTVEQRPHAMGHINPRVP
jgi:hypothetical protein